jgi:hypothetical protein
MVCRSRSSISAPALSRISCARALPHIGGAGLIGFGSARGLVFSRRRCLLIGIDSICAGSLSPSMAGYGVRGAHKFFFKQLSILPRKFSL